MHLRSAMLAFTSFQPPLSHNFPINPPTWHRFSFMLSLLLVRTQIPLAVRGSDAVRLIIRLLRY